MATTCLMLRTNRTMKKKRVRNKCDDFLFEGGLYYVKREKVFLWPKGIFGTMHPHLLFLEGVAEPLYIDNFKFKEYYEDVPMIDPVTKKPKIDPVTKKPFMERKLLKGLQDIFIDARAIHDMTDRKILSVLSASDELTLKDKLLTIGLIIVIVLCFINIGLTVG